MQIQENMTGRMKFSWRPLQKPFCVGSLVPVDTKEWSPSHRPVGELNLISVMNYVLLLYPVGDMHFTKEKRSLVSNISCSCSSLGIVNQTAVQKHVREKFKGLQISNLAQPVCYIQFSLPRPMKNSHHRNCSHCSESAPIHHLVSRNL